MVDTTNPQAAVTEHEVTKSEIQPTTWYRQVSWGAIIAGTVIALLAQFAFEMLGVAIGVGAFEPGQDTLGPNFTTAIVVWLAASALLSLFIGGLVTGKLSGTFDPLSGILQGAVMMGIVTFISFFVLSSSIGATIRGVTNTISDGLSFVGANVEDISTTVANAVTVQDETLNNIRAEAEQILADDASLTSLRIALDDYLLGDEPGNDTRQAAIDALATQTELTPGEAAQQVDEWEAEFSRAATNLEAKAEVVAGDIADIVAATAGIIFMILVLGVFAAGAGGYIAVASQEAAQDTVVRTFSRRQAAAGITT